MRPHGVRAEPYWGERGWVSLVPPQRGPGIGTRGELWAAHAEASGLAMDSIP